MAVHPGEATKRDKGSGARWLQIGFAVFILATMGLLLRGTFASVSQSFLPHSIAGLPLGETVTGDEARKEVNQLHGLNITVQDAFIGHYGGQQAVVWVSVSPTENDSSYLISAMMTKIRQGNAYFGNVQEMTLDGQKLYSLSSTDSQKHYVWQVGRKVIWIAAPRGQEMPFVQEAVRLL